MSDYGPYDSEWEAEDAYRNTLNEVHETVKIGDLVYEPARVLEAVDPFAFRCGFHDWLDGEIAGHEDDNDESEDE
jgi:hypothetical protein